VSILKIYGSKEIKQLTRNLPDTALVVGDDDYKKLKRKPFFTKKEQAPRQIYVQQAKTNRRQSRSQSFVPLDQWSENESSGAS